MPSRPFEEWLTPDKERKLREEARRNREADERIRLGFREAQAEAFEAFEAWEEQSLIDVAPPDTVALPRQADIRQGGRRIDRQSGRRPSRGRSELLRRLVKVAAWTFALLVGAEIARAAFPDFWNRVWNLFVGDDPAIVHFTWPPEEGCQDVARSATTVEWAFQSEELRDLDEKQVRVTLKQRLSERPVEIAWGTAPDGGLFVRVDRRLLSTACTGQLAPSREAIDIVMPELKGAPKCTYHLELNRRDTRYTNAFPFVVADVRGVTKICYVGYGGGGGTGPSWPRTYDTPLPTIAMPTERAWPICVGDCDQNGIVAREELFVVQSIARGDTNISACWAADSDGDDAVSAHESSLAEGNAASGCDPRLRRTPLGVGD